MRLPTHPTGAPRRGFTLIELMVVITIMLLLIGLAAGLSPRISAKKKMTKAAEQIIGVLKTAKQRAKRDGMPTGVRLYVNPTLSAGDPQLYFIQELVPIQQPDALTGIPPNPTMGIQGSVLVARASSQPADPQNPDAATSKKLGMMASFTNVDFTGGFGSATNRYPVQPGDYLEVNGGGLVHRILQVSRTSLMLAPAGMQLNQTYGAGPLSQLHPTNGITYIGDSDIANYRIIRKARGLIGEVSVKLQSDIVIDCTPGSAPFMSTSNNVPVDPATGNMDILFSPSGTVLNGGSGSDAIVLWVRDKTAGDKYSGSPVLITIYSRSGFIAAHPVCPLPQSPYTFTTDGRSSGM
jgi:prepilin-type N-terminal cleavage/methylation domain-containing protein